MPQHFFPAPCILEGYRHCSLGEEMHLPGLCGWSYKKEAIVPDRLCYSLKLHPWVTKNGAELLPTEDENCTLVEVTEEEVENSVKHIPSLATVILVKTMIRKRSFGNPFEGSRREERSLSAPGNLLPKQGSEDNLKCNDLPNVGEEEVLS